MSDEEYKDDFEPGESAVQNTEALTITQRLTTPVAPPVDSEPPAAPPAAPEQPPPPPAPQAPPPLDPSEPLVAPAESADTVRATPPQFNEHPGTADCAQKLSFTFAATKLCVNSPIVRDSKQIEPRTATINRPTTATAARLNFLKLQLLKKEQIDAALSQRSSAVSTAARKVSPPGCAESKRSSQSRITSQGSSGYSTTQFVVTGKDLCSVCCVGPASHVEQILGALSAEERSRLLNFPGKVKVGRSQLGVALATVDGKKVYTIGHGFDATPLMFAVTMDRIDVVLCLLQHGALVEPDPHESTPRKLPTALQIAETNGFSDIFTLLQMHVDQLKRAKKYRRLSKTKQQQP